MRLITTNPESNETIKIYDRYIDILAEFQSLQITLTMWLSELGKIKTEFDSVKHNFCGLF